MTEPRRVDTSRRRPPAPVCPTAGMLRLLPPLVLVFCLSSGRLRNLEVTNHTWLSENGTCEIHLTCSVDNMNDNNLLRWEVAGSSSISEANLTLSWDPSKSSEEKYTCIAENPVSKLSSSVSTQSLCKAHSEPGGQVLEKSEPLPTLAPPGSHRVRHMNSHSQRGCLEPEPTQPPKVA